MRSHARQIQIETVAAVVRDLALSVDATDLAGGPSMARACAALYFARCIVRNFSYKREVCAFSLLLMMDLRFLLVVVVDRVARSRLSPARLPLMCLVSFNQAGDMYAMLSQEMRRLCVLAKDVFTACVATLKYVAFRKGSRYCRSARTLGASWVCFYDFLDASACLPPCCHIFVS